MTVKACPACGWTHPSDAALVYGSRFSIGSRPYAYIAHAVPDAKPRPTRAAAMADYCAWRAATSMRTQP